MPELLSPAGNFEKLKAAILYGADAVYCAGQMFGMRSAADNFTVEELYEAVEYVRQGGGDRRDDRGRPWRDVHGA